MLATPETKQWPSLAEKPTLADLQRHIAEVVAVKGWTLDPNELFILMTEEVGEVAKEVRHSWKRGKDAVRPEISAELADVAMYLFDLANYYGVDLEAAIRAKLEFNKDRECGH